MGASAVGCSSFSSDEAGPGDDAGTGSETTVGEGGGGGDGSVPADGGRALSVVFARAFGAKADAGGDLAAMMPPAMFVEPSGGISLLGSYSGSAVDLGGGGSLSATARHDLYLARLDGTGSFVAARTFGDDKEQYATGLAGTGDRLYAAVVVDGTTQFDTGVVIASDGVPGTFNSAAPRFDRSLKATGVNTFKGTQNVLVKHVAVGASGSQIAFGDWRSSVSINGGSSNTRTAPGPGLVITRTFALSGGDIIRTDYCPDGATFCNAGALGTNPATGEVLAGGRFSGTIGDGDAGSVTAVAGDDDAFLLKLDPQLERRWVMSVRGASTQEVLAIAAVPQTDDFVVAGVFDGTLELPGAAPVSTKGLADVFVLRVDAAGAVVWSRTLGGAGADRVRSIAADGAGNVFLAGSFAGPSLDTGGAVLANADVAGRGTSDAFLVWLDGKGAPVFSQRFGGADDDVASAVGLAGNGDLVVAGSFQGAVDFGKIAVQARGRSDTFVVKLAR